MTAANNQIFISIASYCDAQLVPTVNDLIAKATHPDRLRFGICWQHGPREPTLPFSDDPRFRILDVDWRASKGACWARAEIMSLWRGEEWFLQVDSHCRFALGWDETLIELARQTGSTKPVISTYGSPFKPAQQAGEEEALDANPMLIAFQTFTEDKIPELRPVSMVGWRQRTAPMRARFIGAGFVFAPGCFVQEVPYDPELYFYGEESTMTVRAFTHGYDLFHPHVPLVWHDYIRDSATRHWDNHTADTEGTFDW
ncbi:MAG TPA: GlcNAc-transferase family protein, partial [Acidisarcina sp.]